MSEADSLPRDLRASSLMSYFFARGQAFSEGTAESRHSLRLQSNSCQRSKAVMQGIGVSLFKTVFVGFCADREKTLFLI